MKRTHPPALFKIAQRTLADDHLVARGDTVLVAVSGGPDSMALLHVLAKLAPRLGVRLSACGVDHGLRPAAADELALAARFAAELGVPFRAVSVDVRPGPNLMARARDARFAALEGVLRSLSESHQAGAAAKRYIATAHHADDRAETVLIRLLRGSGPTGLGVLPSRSAHLIRPFVRARRTDVMAHIERHRIPYAEDPSNRDSRFLRTRVRCEVLPLLAELSPRIVEHLCALADAEAELRPPEAGPVPAVLEGLTLGRAQRASLARALAARNTKVRVPLSSGKIASIDLPSRRIVLMKAE